MSRRAVSRFSAALFALALPLNSADSPAATLLNSTAKKIRENAARMPNYTCVETISRAQRFPLYGRSLGKTCQELRDKRREISKPGVELSHDRLRLDVAVVSGSEVFSWAGATKFETGEIGDLAKEGASGSGDFGSFLSAIFSRDVSVYTYTGEHETPLGRLALFQFKVPVERSHYKFRISESRYTSIGYTGSFLVDPKSSGIRRLTVDAEEFPASARVCHVEDQMDYHTVAIGDGSFLLPEVSTMTVLYQDGQEARNETHYSGCRQYSGTSTIRFDDVEGDGSSAEKRNPLPPLPPKMRLRLSLDPAVDMKKAAAGDAITAVVLNAVRDKQHRILVPAKSRVHGRLVKVKQENIPRLQFVAGMRFDSIERDGVDEPIALVPLDDGERWITPHRLRGSEPRAEAALESRKAGVGTFIFVGASESTLSLDSHFRSEWEVR